MAPQEPPVPSDPSTLTEEPQVRLQKFLASCGLGSRRACEELITEGRVTIDGRVARLGQSVQPYRQEIALDGEPLKMERKKYFALNKPAGVVCTNRDPAGRPRIVDLFPPGGPRLFTVGRLDEQSTGLLIVTNDGDLAQKLAHPKHRIYRTYHIHVAGVPDRDTIDQLRQGLHFAEGLFRVHSAKILRKQGQSCVIEVVLAQGHNREIRRLFARVGHKVLKLTRRAFGPVRLGRLARGEFRPLTHDELTELHAILTRNIEEADRPVGERGRKAQRPAKPAPDNPPRAKQATHRPNKRRTRPDEDRTPPRKPHPAVGRGKARSAGKSGTQRRTQSRPPGKAKAAGGKARGRKR